MRYTVQKKRAWQAGMKTDTPLDPICYRIWSGMTRGIWEDLVCVYMHIYVWYVHVRYSMTDVCGIVWHVCRIALTHSGEAAGRDEMTGKSEKWKCQREGREGEWKAAGSSPSSSSFSSLHMLDIHVRCICYMV
jgi:hypothetical protein